MDPDQQHTIGIQVFSSFKIANYIHNGLYCPALNLI